MPQLDLSSYISQIFWFIVCFSSLYFVVSIFIAPKMDKVLNKRKSIIDKHINNANKLKEEANKLFESYEKAIDKAHDDAARNSEKAIKELKNFISERTVSLQKELAEQSEKMHISVRKSKEEALSEINKVATELAIDAAKKIGLRTISKANIDEAINIVKN